ncbi:DUF5133 domain-containing protein [Streptomyces sp. LE64]|uniref:DUF5133 domain-containing protein n=1 Tax=Streptomyces sp. LE64 TaxID=3448653 RepID=UPI0040425EA6
MLKAHPAVLRNLLAIHTSLREKMSEDAATVHTRRQLLDTEYTLCISTGTYTVADALAAARRQLKEADLPTDELVGAVRAEYGQAGW